MRVAIVLIIGIASLLIGQESANQWQGLPQTDALRGTKFTRFVLAGKFLTPPMHPTIPAPLLLQSACLANGFVAFKVKQEPWSPSTDGTAAFFNAATLNTLLYGHFLPHKPDTTPPIRKAVIAVNEYLGGEIVMQFDMPDPTAVADACGGLAHKK